VAALLLVACVPSLGPASAIKDPDTPSSEERQAAERGPDSAIGHGHAGHAHLESSEHHDSAEHDGQSAGAQRATLVPAGGGSGRSWMGVEMRHTEHDGVLLDAVFPGSPAASAGLKAGDRVLTIAGQAIARPGDVHVALEPHGVDEWVVVTVRRAGAERFMRLRLGPKPESGELMHSLYVGQPAPSISSLRTVQGSVVPSLEQLRGQVVVLDFWATWCVACRALSPTLSRWHEELAIHGVRVLAATTEPYPEVAHAVAQLGMDYPVFVDEEGAVSLAYRASALPTVFLIDQAGVVQDVMVGFDPQRLERFRARMGELLRPPSP
jgi:thiol-disulfide isomerase/thioredoxin